MSWGLLYDSTRCNGCGACSAACKEQNELPLPIEARVGLFLRETPVQDDGQLLHKVFQEVGADPETGKIVTTYCPFFRQGADLGLRTNLNAARFEYLVPDSEKEEAHWVSDWLPVPEVPYPWAVRFLWEQDGQRGQVTFPIRAHTFLK